MTWWAGLIAIRRKWWFRFALWGVAWCSIALPLASEQLATYTAAGRRPDLALMFDPGNARALAGVAEAAQLKGQQADALDTARDAIAREPMNVQAMRVQGLALEQAGNMADADKVMVFAGRLGWRDAAVQSWLMKAYASRGDYPSALRRADALARTEKLSDADYAIFTDYLSDDGARRALAREMADRPFWRGKFFYGLLQLPGDRLAPVGRFIDDLAGAGSPVTPPERDIYLTRLVQAGQPGAARAFWLRDQRAGAASPDPWDGGFERVQPAGALVAPFEWRMSPEGAGIATIAPAPAGGHRLSVSPGHDFKGELVSQTMVLAPGRYAVAAKVEGNPAPVGLAWSLRCLPGGPEIGVTSGRGDADFRAGAMFNVPADGCAAQTLAIDAAANDTDAGDTNVTVDDVRVRRIG